MRIRKSPRGGTWAPFPIFTAWTLLAACGAAQDGAGRSDAPAVEKSAEVEPLRVAVIGASVSQGFVCPWSDVPGHTNSTVPLRRALEAVWGDEDVEIRDRSDALTFLDPDGRQRAHVKRSQRGEPELVLGIDFMFWFGYGFVRGGTEGRLALQQKGFEFLESFGDVKMVLGDYPDMAGADPRMLRRGQIPSQEQLKALNAALSKWAEARENVVLFPLADWVAELKREGREVEVGGAPVRLRARDLLQTDDLHASKLGMAVLAEGIARLVEPLDPARFRVPEGLSFEGVVERIGATPELEEALDSIREAAAIEDVEPVEAGK